MEREGGVGVGGGGGGGGGGGFPEFIEVQKDLVYTK